MYISDTHSFLWFLAEDKQLGKKAKEIFLSADKGERAIVIPSIVLMECLYICEKHKVELTFKDIINKFANTLNYPVYSLNMTIVFECQNLRQIPDLHDRIIIATAKILNAKLITKDEKIIESGLVKTIW